MKAVIGSLLMVAFVLAIGIASELMTACNSPQDRALSESRNDAVFTMDNVGCDNDNTPAEVKARCAEVRARCYDGPVPEQRATANGCDAAVASLVAITIQQPVKLGEPGPEPVTTPTP